MPKFTYRLATLLKLREATRDERRQALADAMHAERLLSDEIDALSASIEELTRRAQARSLGPLNVDELLGIQRYELLQRAQRTGLEQQRKTVAAEIETRRAALAEADRGVKTLEQLRETQRARHEHDERRREMKLLDDAASQRWLREVRP